MRNFFLTGTIISGFAAVLPLAAFAQVSEGSRIAQSDPRDTREERKVTPKEVAPNAPAAEAPRRANPEGGEKPSPPRPAPAPAPRERPAEAPKSMAPPAGASPPPRATSDAAPPSVPKAVAPAVPHANTPTEAPKPAAPSTVAPTPPRAPTAPPAAAAVPKTEPAPPRPAVPTEAAKPTQPAPTAPAPTAPAGQTPAAAPRATSAPSLAPSAPAPRTTAPASTPNAAAPPAGGGSALPTAAPPEPPRRNGAAPQGPAPTPAAPLPAPGASTTPEAPRPPSTGAGSPNLPRVGAAPTLPNAVDQARPSEARPPGAGATAGAVAAGAAAGLVGGYLAAQGVRSFDDVRRQRQETTENGLQIVREPGRTIVREEDRVFVRHDENERFRELGGDIRAERRGNEDVTIYERGGGEQIVTITDESGRLVRRSRRGRDGRETVIIDNGARAPGSLREDIVSLPMPQLRIPRERYIVEADQVDETVIYETLVAEPIAPVLRHYTLDQVRYSPDLRAQMRSINLSDINFETGVWILTADQTAPLNGVAQAVKRALQRNPNEVFLIEGHTDAVGSDIDNLSLSDRRAQSVAAVLTRDFQIPPENLTTQGYGSQYPKVQTTGASRENRRVTLRRITPLIAAAPVPPPAGNRR